MDAGKKSFLWLVALFVAPILLGTLLFFNLEKLGFEKGSVNYGTLIQPAFPLEVRDLETASGSAVREETLSKKWTMLYIETEECDTGCKDRLLLMKRLRLLMNEQMRRVRTTFVASVKVGSTIPKEKNPDLVISSIDLASSEFLKQFPHADKAPIYLIDPLGNLMMYYPQVEPDAKKMILDLKKLLKYSKLG